MTTPDTDHVRAFRNALPGWVRAQLHDTQRITAFVTRAVDQGWTIEQLAAACTRDLTGYRNPGGLVCYRLASCAEGPPPPNATAPKVKPFCSPDCAGRRGLIEDPKTGRPIGKCPCRSST